MKIDRIETFTRDHLCFVKVHTEDGAEGMGQAAPYNADITTMVLHRQIARFFLGRSTSDLTRCVHESIIKNHKYPWSYLCRALAGVETAIWDLIGKTRGKSVCELLGGVPRTITAYGSSMSRETTPEQEAERLVMFREEQGFNAFKIRIGKECGENQDAWPGRTEAVVPAVRAALPSEVKLLVDANSCYTPRKAIEIGRMLQDNDVCHYEEPCPYWELEWTAEVAAALEIDIAGGEQDNDLAQWRRMIAMNAVNIVQPDVCYIGGMIRSMAVAEMAAAQGKTCIPHAANRSMVTLFTMHLLAAIPNAGPYLEFSIESQPWSNGLFEPALEIRNGSIDIPPEPGWGVEVNPDWLSAASRQESTAE